MSEIDHNEAVSGFEDLEIERYKASKQTLIPYVNYTISLPNRNFKFNYTGDWIGQSGVNGTSQNTLHVSNTIGDSVQLSFVGQKVQIAYQAAPSLGTIAIRLDSVDFTVDQSSSEISIETWESPVLTLSSHTITITHISGGSINLDEVAVIDISTPTPTLTPTP